MHIDISLLFLLFFLNFILFNFCVNIFLFNLYNTKIITMRVKTIAESQQARWSINNLRLAVRQQPGRDISNLCQAVSSSSSRLSLSTNRPRHRSLNRRMYAIGLPTSVDALKTAAVVSLHLLPAIQGSKFAVTVSGKLSSL